jgi:transcriptional repressor NrdR
MIDGGAESAAKLSCPSCASQASRILETRPQGEAIRRRRECLNCSVRFTTIERVITAKR